MTRLPAENQDVLGIDYCEKYPKYKVGPLCSVPTCSSLADHAHHVWRRSFLTGDYGWVRLWDGTILQNLCALCYKHHNEVTENKASIRWTGNRFVWDDSRAQGFMLDPHPKIWGVTSELPKPAAEHVHAPGAKERCPSCNQSLPRPKTPREKGRPRKSWTVTVPVDERENGADVLDTLMEECAKIMGYDDEKATRYFVLSHALYLIIQNEKELTSDG